MLLNDTLNCSYRWRTPLDGVIDDMDYITARRPLPQRSLSCPGLGGNKAQSKFRDSHSGKNCVLLNDCLLCPGTYLSVRV